MSDVGKQFKEARIAAGLTARRVSVALDVSTQTVFNWESGRYMPEADKLPAISELYGKTIDELMKG